MDRKLFDNRPFFVHPRTLLKFDSNLSESHTIVRLEYYFSLTKQDYENDVSVNDKSILGKKSECSHQELNHINANNTIERICCQFGLAECSFRFSS